MLGLSAETAALLGASAAIGIPLIFNLIKEICFDRRKRNAERAYISVQLVFLLDKFVARCADVAWDEGYDPTMPEPNDEELADQTDIPAFDMSSVKGEHKYLKPEMLARIHSIEIKLNQANEELFRDGVDWFGELWRHYKLRRELYANVGLFAAEIADDLRKEFDIQNVDGWEPSERIRRSLKSLNKVKAERKKRKRQRKIEREERKAQEIQKVLP